MTKLRLDPTDGRTLLSADFIEPSRLEVGRLGDVAITNEALENIISFHNHGVDVFQTCTKYFSNGGPTLENVNEFIKELRHHYDEQSFQKFCSAFQHKA